MRIKIFNLIFLAFLIIFDIYAQVSKTHFRNTSWGMSEEQVKKIEKSKFEGRKLMDDGLLLLVYKGKQAGYDCSIGYGFAEDRLVEASYRFLIEHTNHNLYIDDYNNVLAQLKEKYGTPYEKTIWNNSFYKDDPDALGLALSMGHVTLGAMWNLSETEVGIILTGDNFEINLAVFYNTKIKELIDLKKQVQDKAKKAKW
jgi:hypothetical protein